MSLQPYVLTRETEWNPHTVRLSSIYADGRHGEGEIDTVCEWLTGEFLRDAYDLNPISCVYEPENFADRLISQVIVHSHPADLPNARGFQSSKRHSSQTPEELSNMWHIGIETAKKTLKVTMNRGIRSAVLPLSRRYRTDLFYRKKHLHGKFYTDTMFGQHKSLNGNPCAQVFANKSLFIVAYPMDSKAKAGHALREFINEYGVPEELTFDGSKEQTSKNSEFMKNIRKFGIAYHVSEPYQPRQNPAEGVIREVRVRWFRVMRQKHVPRRLGDYGFCWVCEIMTRTANEVFSLEG
jgi:hypothetical protein